MLFNAIGLASLFFVSFCHAQINRCPTSEEQILTNDGSIYAICQQTDYQGDTTRFVGTVATLADCVKACNQDSQCKQAVYDKTAFGCHLKATSGLVWVQNQAFTTIRFISNPSQGSVVTSCPAGETNITSTTGSVIAVCPNTDYEGTTIDAVGGITSFQDCSAACDRNTQCSQAVFQKSTSQCYIKGEAKDLRWVYNTGFDTIRTLANVTQSPTVAKMGKWSNIIPFPIIPVAAYVVPAEPSASRLLVFSSWGDRAFSGPTGITQFADYNFLTGAVSRRTVTNTKHDMFCPGISSLSDGRIVITGGKENAEAVSIYNPATNAFSRAADMKIARGYQTSATLSDGRIFTIGGSFTGPLGGKTGEVYNPTNNQWTLLQGTDPGPLLTKDREGIWREDNHAWLFGWRNGSVFQAGPSKTMHWYYTANQGSVAPAGTRTTEMDQMCGVNVMYDVGKILSAGGSQDYTDSAATKSAHLISITDPGVPATVEKVQDMAWARGFANGVVLPDGKVIVTGGQLRSQVFTDVDSVLVPEMFDPSTKSWTQLAPAAVPRNYHSVSILLPDGTVFVGGGGMCPAAQGDNLDWCDRAKDHFDGEVFSPPYLFTAAGTLAPRPTISSISASKLIVGATVTVSLANNVADATFVMVRMGSATHSINSDQRRVPITNAQRNSAGAYTLRLPNDYGVMIPGPWYLFAMTKNGVPSVARTIYVQK
ncbi:kelch domain-containing protein [Boeremia exigua]|uniref:kelch domain-containing protein n=1 Tax=Boeremia exigua TaxID=749465 RepID=UPI001E8D71E4|nr:kelch domain-containing protein [Boeremia exigua]KAH6616458.1 kelch domain-containing protein [Boeremia exigua]